MLITNESMRPTFSQVFSGSHSTYPEVEEKIENITNRNSSISSGPEQRYSYNSNYF